MEPEELMAYYQCRARTLATENHELHRALTRARAKNRAHKKNIRSMQRKLELYEAKLQALRAGQEVADEAMAHSSRS